MKQDLSWLQGIFETYKTNLDVRWDQGDDMTPGELRWKRQAANEILEEIKDFIRKANEVTRKQKPQYEITNEKALADIKQTLEINKMLCEKGLCIHKEHQNHD